ncbi:MAG: aminotransferase class I/II-fold pyridoxal phosphate-dependent enzyme [Flavobacteriales bacterium]
MDLFEKLRDHKGPIGQHADKTHGYFTFPKLEGPISNKMTFRGKECLVWSINNYLGLANDPEVRKADAEAAKEWGLAYPMGARMMSGQTRYHEQLEEELSELMEKEDTFLLNYGYQGCQSVIDAVLDRKDVMVYDSESHACIVDGARLHQGKRFIYKHNDVEDLEKKLERARKLTEQQGGGILVVSEGVFGMAGDQGKLKEVVALKERYDFRFLVDDAHGFGTLGEKGRGTGFAQGVQDGVDLYFGTFAKSMAGIGAFISAEKPVVDYLRYNMRSQTFAKSLPLPMVIGSLKRLELLQERPELRENLWHIAKGLQKGLLEADFDIGRTDSAVTPVFLKGDLGEATNLTLDLRENHRIFSSIVVYPVIPKGEIMLRLIPTAVHTHEDVEHTIKSFKEVQANLKEGKYQADQAIADWK